MTLTHGAAGRTSWRADIDGLRAVAILAVVAYHFFPGAWQGGFVGVDIFFVISGYLITRILLHSRDQGRFCIVSFYARRVRRIFPALVVVLAAVIAAALLVLYDDERVPLGTHVVGGATFLSNFVLWRESGYFDAAIESKPLAHLWSLGVEEQFYIVWPLLLWWTLRSRYPLRIVAVLLAASLLGGAWLVGIDRTAAFYVPVFRFWELLAGALLVFAERRGLPAWLHQRAAIVSGTGFGLLGLCLLVIHPALPFPGWWAMLPVAGATLVIAAGPGAPINRLILSSPPMVWIGQVSFPLYLWHWPVLALARILFNGEPDWRGMLLLLAVSVLLAWLTWKYVEGPVRAPGGERSKVIALVATMVVILGGGVVLQQVTGVRSPGEDLARRIPPGPAVGLAGNVLLADDCRLADPAQRRLVLRCLRDARGPERLALVGDSKAEALYEGLVRTSSPSTRWLFVGGALQHSSVVPVLTEALPYRRHQAAARLALDTIVRNPRIDTVAIAMATRSLFRLAREDTIEDLPTTADPQAAREGLKRFVTELLQAGKEVVLVVDNPTLPDPRKCRMTPRFVPPQPLNEWFSVERPENCRISLQRHRQLSLSYRALLEDVRRLAPERIAIFDTLEFLCDARTDGCGLTDGDNVLYSYTDHISGYAARKIGAALNAVLERPRAGPRLRVRGSSAVPPAPSADSRD